MNRSSGKGFENSHFQQAPCDAGAAGAGTTLGAALFYNIHPNTLQSVLRRDEAENKEQSGNSICRSFIYSFICSFIHLTNVYIETVYAKCHCKHGEYRNKQNKNSFLREITF